MIGEFVSRTPETETQERRFWDSLLNAFDSLTDVTDDLDLFGEIEDLREDTQEDALTKLYNYTLMVSVEDGQSSKLEAVYTLLSENELIELED